MPIFYSYFLPKLVKKLQINVIFNFGDIVIPTDVRQIYYFDWPYAIYPKGIVWKRLGIKKWLYQKVKLYFFKRYLNRASVIIAQTKVVEEHLSELYKVNKIIVIPSPVTLEVEEKREVYEFNLPKGKIKLLYLTHFYSHKNIEIFLPLAELIRKRRLPFVLIVTLANEQCKAAKHFLKELYMRGLDKIILNLGPISRNHVSSLYQQCDILLMPTLLESYGLPYIEAFSHLKPVLTSDLDFARVVCQNAALYFDPLCADSILSTILKFTNNNELKNQMKKKAKDIIDTLPNWHWAFEEYQKLLHDENTVEEREKLPKQ